MTLLRFRLLARGLLGLSLIFGTLSMLPPERSAQAEETEASGSSAGILIPMISSERGRTLFVSKGCVICHSINGVGGEAAPALDADENKPYVDVFDFMARMWRGSIAMTSLQAMEFGYQIQLEGNELADIVGFVYDREEQQRFSEDDVPELIQDWIIHEPYDVWEGELEE